MSAQSHQGQLEGEGDIYSLRGVSREFLLLALIEGTWSQLNSATKLEYALALARADLTPAKEVYQALQEASQKQDSAAAVYNILVEKARTLTDEEETMWSESLQALIDPVFDPSIETSSSEKNFELFRNLLFTPGNRAKFLGDFRNLTKEQQDETMGWYTIEDDRRSKQESQKVKCYSKVIWNARFL